jgi:hypothetical protein
LVAFQILDNPANPFEGFNIDAVFRSDSSRRTRLVSQAESGSSSYPSWGVEGTSLGFMTTVGGTAYFVMQGVEVDQGIIRRVGDPTVVELGEASRVAWHGPTNRVAYDRVPPMAETGNVIYYYDIGSPAERQLTDKDTNDGSNDENPTWSPSGDHIIYSSFKDVDFRNELYAVSVETGNVSRITTTGDDETEPAWSPDGSRVAYVSNGDLYVLVLDTSLLPE